MTLMIFVLLPCATSGLLYHASCFAGLEKVLADELIALGASRIHLTSRGVEFEGPEEVGYGAVTGSRIANRVTEVVVRGYCDDRDDLYDLTRSVAWHRLISPSDTIAVDARLGNTEMSHSHFTALTVKNGIVDAMREKEGRPSVDVDDPDVPLTVYVHAGEATIGRSMSGRGSMHKRGYRDKMHVASLKETLAAGCLSLMNASAEGSLVDPMCGSGTLVIEEALRRRRVAPGLLRLGLFGDGARSDFVVTRWKDTDEEKWKRVVEKCLEDVLPGPSRSLFASDKNPSAVALAKRDCLRAGVASDIRLDNREVGDVVASTAFDAVVSNPPWGKRVTGAEEAWSDLGQWLKRSARCAGLLCGDPPLSRELRLRAKRKVKLNHAGDDLTFLNYDIYV